MKFILHILLHTIAIAAVFWAIELYLFPAEFQIISDPWWFGYIVVAFIFGIINTFIKPLLKIAMLPIQLFTLGLSGFLLNAVILWGLVQTLEILALPGIAFTVEGLLTYVIAGLIIGISNMVIHKIC